MRKHMTNGQMIRIKKLLSNGVTDMAELQAVVPVHADCIKQVAKVYLESQKADGKKPAAKKKAAVDPIS